MVPTDGTTISLESISLFWHLDNWDQCTFLFKKNIKSSSCLVNKRRSLKLTFPYSPANNISLQSIMHASQSNDAVFNSDGINNHLIDMTRRQQSLLFD